MSGMCEVCWTVRVCITCGVRWPAARSVCWPVCDLQLGRYTGQVVTCSSVYVDHVVTWSSVSILARLWHAAWSVCWPGCDVQLGRLLTRLWRAAQSVYWPGCDVHLCRYVDEAVTYSSFGILGRMWRAAWSVCWPGCDLQPCRRIDQAVTYSSVHVLAMLRQNDRGILVRIPKPPDKFWAHLLSIHTVPGAISPSVNVTTHLKHVPIFNRLYPPPFPTFLRVVYKDIYWCPYC